jgi:hypothetical protein
MQLKLRSNAVALAALFALTAALLGGIRATTADAATSEMRDTVKLEDLNVRSTEDVSGAFGNGDELYIRSGGKIIWRANGSVEEGSGSIAVNRTVKVGGTVALYDADGGPDRDDLLGAEIVRGTSGTLSFLNDDASYRLFFS